MKKEFITLYHFTSIYGFKMIVITGGIAKGDVPISPVEGKNAVWLTDDNDVTPQKWSTGSLHDKTAVRLKVDIRKDNRQLIKWSDYAAKQKIEKDWYDILNASGGYGADNWYLYFGMIPLVAIEKVEVWNKNTGEYEERRML